jgi:hypothetical protein
VGDDDLTIPEIARSLRRLEESDRSLGNRITESAREAVPAKLWAAQHQALEGALAEHIRQSGTDRERLERAVAEMRKAHDRDVRSLRDDLDKEIGQARAENRTQIDALKAEREKRTEFTWQRAVGLLSAALALAGVIVAAYAASRGIH